MSPSTDLARDLRPEMRLLLLCARTRIGEDEAQQIRDLVAGEIDWTSLVQSALHHHVTPLVARALAITCPDALPAELMEAFRVHAEEIREENERLTDDLLALLQSLEARGVVAVPFKGPVLAEQVYGDRGLRTFRDLDFLIEADDLPVTLDVLRAHDYDVDSPFTAAQLRSMRRALGQDSFVHRARRTVVEPHWAFVPDKMALAIDYPALRARRRRIPFKDVSVWSFALEDVAVIVSVHGAKELWWRLNWVCDVAELIAGGSALDWEVALERARRQGARRMLLLAVTLAQRLIGVAPPPALAPQLGRDHTTTRLADEAVERLLAGTMSEGPSFNVLSGFRRRVHDGWRPQAAYVLRTMFRPGPAHYGMIALPSRLSFVYYLVRALHDYVLLPAWRLRQRLPGATGPRPGQRTAATNGSGPE